jgi:ABC-type Zn2+ transport system substrate-binding protein/surface adhesin
VRKLIQIFAIWLIAIILPVQGFAAVSMMNCEKPQSQHIHESVSGHSHEHHEGAAESHAHKHQDDTKHACNHCSKCSVCCSGLVFAASGDDLKHHLIVAGTAIGFINPHFTSHISSGPERPPRFILI